MRWQCCSITFNRSVLFNLHQAFPLSNQKGNKKKGKNTWMNRVASTMGQSQQLRNLDNLQKCSVVFVCGRSMQPPTYNLQRSWRAHHINFFLAFYRSAPLLCSTTNFWIFFCIYSYWRCERRIKALQVCFYFCSFFIGIYTLRSYEAYESILYFTWTVDNDDDDDEKKRKKMCYSSA